MKNIFPLLIAIGAGCANAPADINLPLSGLSNQEEITEPPKSRRFAGALSNGMKYYW